MQGLLKIRLTSVIDALADFDRECFKDQYDTIYTCCEETFDFRPSTDSVSKLLAASIVIQLLEYLGDDGTNTFINCVEHFIESEEKFEDDKDEVIVEETHLKIHHSTYLIYDDYGSAYSTMEELLHDIICHELPERVLKELCRLFRIDNRSDVRYSYLDYGTTISHTNWCVGG